MIKKTQRSIPNLGYKNYFEVLDAENDRSKTLELPVFL